MKQKTAPQPHGRRERLSVVAKLYTEDRGQSHLNDVGGDAEPAPRFVAVISEGAPESSSTVGNRLLLSGTCEQLAELLRQECAEGWVAHGRVWDLDAPFDIWGNLGVSYRVRLGAECTRPVHKVRVKGRGGDIYLFDDPLDAEAFVGVLARQGRDAVISRHPVHDNRAADRLIDAERQPV